MSTIKQAPKKSKQKNAMLPVIGLTLIIALGAIAYFVAPELIKIGEKHEKVGPQLEEFKAEQDRGELILHLATAGVLWLVGLAFSMFIVSISIGKDPERAALMDMPASPANKKAQVKELRKRLKEAERREKMRKQAEKQKK